MKTDAFVLWWLNVAILLTVFWFFLDINPDEKVDWFVFIDFEQKIKWYVHYTAHYLGNIIQIWIILHLTYKYSHHLVAKMVFIFLLYACWRLIDYWLFRGQTPRIPILGGIFITSLGTYYISKWLK